MQRIIRATKLSAISRRQGSGSSGMILKDRSNCRVGDFSKTLKGAASFE
jgi:hypothetical protein